MNIKLPIGWTEQRFFWHSKTKSSASGCLLLTHLHK